MMQSPVVEYINPSAIDLPSQWSDWKLHNNGQPYYCRARRISRELAETVVVDSRNTVISDGQGFFCHYNFLSIDEARNLSYMASFTNSLSAANELGTTTVCAQSDEPNVSYKQPVQVADVEKDVSHEATNVDQAIVMETGRTVIDIDTTAEGIRISLPNFENQGHGLVLDRKTRRHLKSRRNKQMSPKKKVGSWLES